MRWSVAPESTIQLCLIAIGDGYSSMVCCASDVFVVFVAAILNCVAFHVAIIVESGAVTNKQTAVCLSV